MELAILRKNLGVSSSKLDTLSKKHEVGRNAKFRLCSGKVYDLSFHPERQDWAIANKNGNVIVDVQAGKVVANNITQGERI